MAQNLPDAWDDEADVVIVGAGATGLPAAIAAREGGASVIIVEANWDVGGHATVSGAVGNTLMIDSHGRCDNVNDQLLPQSDATLAIPSAIAIQIGRSGHRRSAVIARP